MDSSYSVFVQSPWNQTQTNDSMPYPMNKNQQPSLKRPRLNRGTAKIFYKTRMCAKFKAGTCMNGDPCNFAHGVEDLRQPPSNWQEIVGPPERERPSSSVSYWEDDQKIILRMKLCRKFCFGEECPYGDRCNFVHEDLSKFREENGKLRESLAIRVVGSTDPASVENGVVKTVYWKTRICIKFENGQCPFGDSCHFAHGQAELLRHSGDAVNAVASANEAFAMKSAAAQVVTADSSGINDEGRREKCLLKWSDSKKINRIYGDWIDDLPVES